MEEGGIGIVHQGFLIFMSMASPLPSAIDLAARVHLEAGETIVPRPVQITVDYFNERGLWFKLSRNPKVLSCRDAASRRRRLGNIGIPLHDELRSYLMEGRDDAGKPVFALFHCRGNARFDLDAAVAEPELQQFTLGKANTVEIDDTLIGYGLVNPFTAEYVLGRDGVSVTQFFDPSVADGSGETGTMMTNAGDYTWAIEFDPREVLASKPAPGRLVNIAVIEEQVRTLPTIGILTGNAPASGALLWGKINAGVRKALGDEFRGDVSYPRVILHSSPSMGWTMELAGRESAIHVMVASEIKAIATQGAKLVAIACNTTQYFVDELNATDLRDYSVHVVPLADAVDRFVADRGNERVFLAGIGVVTNAPEWSAFRRTLSRPNVVLPDARQSKMIEDLAYLVKQGAPKNEVHQKFRAFVRASSAPRLLLMLTELSMIFDIFPRSRLGSVEITDALDLYSEAVVSQAIGKMAG